MYFSKHRLAIEVDEKVHIDRNIDYEIKRQKAIKKEIDCEFIRIDPDGKDFDIYVEVYNHIKESKEKLTKKLTEKSSIYKISKRLCCQKNIAHIIKILIV